MPPRPKSATSQRASSATGGRRGRPQSAAASMDAGPSLVDVLTVMSDRVEAAKVLARLDAPEVDESMHARLFREIAQREAEMEKLQRLDKKIHNELQNLDENINKMRDFVDGSRVARKAAPATVGQMSYAHVPTATKSKFADWKQFSAAKRTLRVSSTVSFLCLVDFLVNPATILNRAVQDIVQGIKERKNYLAPNIKYLRNMRMQYQQWEALELEERDWPRREAEQAAQAAKAAYARWANEAAFAAGAALAAERERVRRADEAPRRRGPGLARAPSRGRTRTRASDGAAAFLAALAASRDEARRELDAFLTTGGATTRAGTRSRRRSRRAARGRAPSTSPRRRRGAAAASRRSGPSCGSACRTSTTIWSARSRTPRASARRRGAGGRAGDAGRPLRARRQAPAARGQRRPPRGPHGRERGAVLVVDGPGLVENADAPHRGRRHAQDRLAAGISAAGAGANGARRQRQRHSRSAAALRSGPRADFE
ncbi:macrocin-O-methyltransferase [Aureococcus anophagefferens]|nr:macrocin-O-methyltransferase [Aureococcus anophagefferens]